MKNKRKGENKHIRALYMRRSKEAVPLSELEKILTLGPKIISDKLKMASMDTMELRVVLPR